LGVIIGIFFIGIEISQGTRATRAQTAQGVWDQLNQFAVTIASSERDRNVFNQFLRSGYEGLSGDERGAASRLFRQNLSIYDNAYYQFQQGSLDDDAYSRYRRVLESRIELPGFERFWEGQAYMFTDSFQSYINSMRQLQ